MCSYCKDVSPQFGIPHPVFSCPVLRASYCSVCCSYGHLTEECGDDETLECREVQFMEQLVSPSVLQLYKITTTTPIAKDRIIRRSKHEAVLEVEESDKAIRAVLMNYDVQPSGKMKENRRLLKQIADQEKRKLVYIASK